MGALENSLGHQSVSEMILSPAVYMAMLSGIANPFLASSSWIHLFNSVKFLEALHWFLIPVCIFLLPYCLGNQGMSHDSHQVTSLE
ncbi:hypothetical protein ACSQ67_018554 [Phaseolus vulgaris]